MSWNVVPLHYSKFSIGHSLFFELKEPVRRGGVEDFGHPE
tara:strand:+ start:4092 stop:4211 length:120 start_codon:yes stop_codon:yes gene_type:complete